MAALRKGMAARHVLSMSTSADMLIRSAIDSWGHFDVTEMIVSMLDREGNKQQQQQQMLGQSIGDHMSPPTEVGTTTSFALSSQQPNNSVQSPTNSVQSPFSIMTTTDVDNLLNSSAGGGNILAKSSSMEELNQLLDQLSTESIAAEISKGNLMVNTGKYVEAIALFTSIIDPNPLIPSAYLGRGTSNAILGNLDDAIFDFSRVIELDNTMADAYKRRGQSRVAKGFEIEAMEDFNQAAVFDKDNDHDIYYNRGLLHYQLRNYERALKDFRKVVSIEPTHKLAWNRIGLCLNVKGCPREAFDAFSKALELDPSFEASYTNIGQCWKDIGDYRRSFEAFTKALDCCPNYSNALHLRGLLFFNSGKHFDALKDWTIFLDAEPANMDVRQLRAITHHTLGRYRSAIEDYSKITSVSEVHYAYYQREVGLLSHHLLDVPFNQYNLDMATNIYVKTFWCQRVAPTTLVGYQPQKPVSAQIEDVDTGYRPNMFEVTLIQEASRIGRRLQYDCEGFLANSRQHLQCGMAAIEIAQTLKRIWSCGNPSSFVACGASSSVGGGDHPFGWRDLYDIAVRWRQFSEPNDPVWWVDRLSPEQFKEGFGSHTPIITGQTNVVRYYPMFGRALDIVKNLLPIQLPADVQGDVMDQVRASTTCKELYRAIKKEFYVVTPCFSGAIPNRIMQGTRLTLQYVYPEGYEFAIRTPCTPERWAEYDEEMSSIWTRLVSAVADYQGSQDQQKMDALSDLVLQLTFYWYNFMPLTRGSAAVGYTVLLGVFLSLDIDIVANIPHNQQPDWEAILRPTPDTFIQVIKPWMYPARQRNDISALPIVSQSFDTLRKMIQVLNQASLS
eukprot:gene9737-11372_t